MAVIPIRREVSTADPLADSDAIARQVLLPKTCTGSCNEMQGRGLCDCVADLDEPEPSVSFEHQAVLASLLWAFALVCAIALVSVLP
jgi:hypothetical protein